MCHDYSYVKTDGQENIHILPEENTYEHWRSTHYTGYARA